MKNNAVIFSLQGISKTFGPVKALRRVDLEIYRGKIHAIIGENGAGKSTLMKILSGAYRPDPEGKIFLNSKPYQPENPAEGRRAGIAMIYQELNLALHLTVEENILLGIEQSTWGWNHGQSERIKDILTWLGYSDLSPDTKVSELNIGQRQVIEIARALASNAKVIIMDEPTSSLTGDDSKTLFKIIRQLKEKGISIVYISHFLEEVKEIADRFTVLRDGELVTTSKVADAAVEEMIEHMVGRTVEELYPRIQHEIRDKVLEVKGLSAHPKPQKLSFSLHRGEIFGIAGLVGAGRSETIRAVFGLQKVKEGTLCISDNPHIKATFMTPPRALVKGLDFLSENRKEEGMALNMSITSNITLSSLKKYSRWGFIKLKEEARAAIGYINQLQLKCRDAQQDVQDLSGGNQQKASFARLLHHDSDIFFLDEPTRGIDVGSKADIYRIIQELAAQGKAIIMVSSYLPELFGVCDSLAVMHRGRMSPVKAVREWSEKEVMMFATSGKISGQ